MSFGISGPSSAKAVGNSGPYSSSKAVSRSLSNTKHWSPPGAPSRSLSPSPISSASRKRANKLGKSHVKAGGPGAPVQTVIPAGFAFVVQVGSNPSELVWRYLTFEYANVLGYSNVPMLVFPEVTPSMHKFWKRCVIDSVFCANEREMHLESVKLVEVHNTVKDVTDRLFADESFQEDSMRMAALAKLSPNDAKLLGLESQYTMMKIMQGVPRQGEDEALVQDMRELQQGLGIDRMY